MHCASWTTLRSSARSSRSSISLHRKAGHLLHSVEQNRLFLDSWTAQQSGCHPQWRTHISKGCLFVSDFQKSSRALAVQKDYRYFNAVFEPVALVCHASDCALIRCAYSFEASVSFDLKLSFAYPNIQKPNCKRIPTNLLLADGKHKFLSQCGHLFIATQWRPLITLAFEDTPFIFRQAWYLMQYATRNIQLLQDLAVGIFSSYDGWNFRFC